MIKREKLLKNTLETLAKANRKQNIMTQASMANVTVEIITGKKNDREWQAIKLTIGEWSTLIFTKSAFELKHIKEQLGV